VDFDVIVVGGGPAGSTAAKALGEAGCSSLVLDKCAFPRDKPCGGGISARVVNRFPYLSVALAGVAQRWVSKIYFESPDGSVVEYESEEPLYLMIRRCEFDHLLLSLATSGVECHTDALVRKIVFETDRVVISADVAGESREYSSRMVLGCDGANSVVARAAGLRTGGVQNEFAIDMMEETPFAELNFRDRDRMYVYYRIQGQYGYGYVFPKAQHVNLGVGFKLDYYLSQLRGRHYSYHQAFVEELKSNGLVDGESNERNFRAFPLPITGPLARTHADRALLAGDAGGFVNAFTAEGIYYAMVSGQHAGLAAAEAIRANRFDSRQLRGYELAWKREIGLELSKSVKIQRLLMTDATRVDRIVRAASRNPALKVALARYATGALSHPQFKRALMARALPIYLREKASALAGSLLP
jgi:geranylgeranyl reductase family protein